jgi:serine/threonine-protein kinase
MKPENIFLIHREGRPEFVKILDFGIAKIMGLDPNGPRLTRTGTVFGTPEYMAPEQAEGKEADYRADVYAVGCIAYHLMTGRTPFIADNFMAMLTKHMTEDPVPPSVCRPDLAITPEMDALVGKALEKDRNKRYQNMAEFLQAVSTCRGPDKVSGQPGAASYTLEMGGAHAKADLKVVEPVERASDADLGPLGEAVAASEFGDRPARPARRRPSQKLILAAVGVVLGAAGGGWLALHLRNAPAPSPAAATVIAPPAPAPTPAPAPAPAAPAPAQAATPTLPSPTPITPSPAEPTVETPPVADQVAASAQPERRSAAHKTNRGRAHPSTGAAKKGAVSAPGKPALPRLPPSDLKPFPGM